MGGLTGNLTPDGVKTGIDVAMYEKYQRAQQPGYVSANDGFFFKQSGTDGKVAVIWEEDSNVGAFEAVEEQEEIPNTDTFYGNQKTKYSQKFVKQIPISDEFARADQHGKRASVGVQIGDRARLTQDKLALIRTYGDAFNGSFNTTPDGQNWASNSHVPLKGPNTVDNLETGLLSPDNLWTCVNSLANQRAQDSEAGSQIFEGLLVPFLLYKTAKEVMDSSLLANSAENNVNIFDTDYGQVRIGASIFLGATYNAAANANTSYHILSQNHMNQRKVFYGLETKMISPEYSANDSYVLRAKYHEMTFPGSWTGYLGSSGASAS